MIKRSSKAAVRACLVVFPLLLIGVTVVLHRMVALEHTQQTRVHTPLHKKVSQKQGLGQQRQSQRLQQQQPQLPQRPQQPQSLQRQDNNDNKKLQSQAIINDRAAQDITNSNIVKATTSHDNNINTNKDNKKIIKSPHIQQSPSQIITPTNPSKPLPRWIQDYLQWHQSMRAQYPGSRLFTDSAAPKILLRTCLGLCGGLNDRLGQLPWDLYIANQTQRVLLMHWHRPVALEHFLLPNELDWSVPQDMPGFFPPANERIVSREGMKVVRGYTDFFANYSADRPDEDFWRRDFSAAMRRAKEGEYRDIKVLRHRLLGHLHEDQLEARLRLLGETDMIHTTASFGNVFWMFFRPSVGVQQEIESVYRDLQLRQYHYSAVHCRVRHPKAVPRNVSLQSRNADHTADKVGLVWEGETRAFAIETAVHALKCAKTLMDGAIDEPIYMFSDSNDLVHYMAHELQNSTRSSIATTKSANDAVAFGTTNVSTATNSHKNTDQQAMEIARRVRIVARQAEKDNAHIDLQKGRSPPEYYSTFVDFLLAVYARCVTYGIGNYALFATKVSGTTCKLLYQEEYWGKSGRKLATAPRCEL
jgi:hypothetical protein